MAENFANLMLDTESQIQEVYRTTRIINIPKIYTQVYYILTIENKKQGKHLKRSLGGGRILEEWENVLPLIRITFWTSLLETMQASREWSEILVLYMIKIHQLKILYPKKLSFKSLGETEFIRKTLRKCVASRPYKKFYRSSSERRKKDMDQKLRPTLRKEKCYRRKK